MNILFWGLTISMTGKLLLAAGVLMAHSKIEHEHKIDGQVIRAFHRERVLTIIGIILILIGYGLELYFYGADTNMLTCTGDECEAAAAAILSV